MPQDTNQGLRPQLNTFTSYQRYFTTFLLQPLLTLHLFDEHGERDQIIGILGHYQVLRTVIKCCVSFCTVSEAQNQHIELLF